MYKIVVSVFDKKNYSISYADTLNKALQLVNDILYAAEIDLDKKGVTDIYILKV